MDDEEADILNYFTLYFHYYFTEQDQARLRNIEVKISSVVLDDISQIVLKMLTAPLIEFRVTMALLIL